MKSKNETKRAFNGIDRKAAEEEASLQKRMNSYQKRYESMSSAKKKEEVKTLLQKLKVYRKKIQEAIFQMKKLLEEEIEIEKKLRMIGERMRR